MTEDEQRRETAYHEAGHFVACFQLGIDQLFPWVSIAPSERFEGFVSFADDHREATPDRRVIILAFGYLAAVRASPGREVECGRGAGRDFEEIGAVLKRFSLTGALPGLRSRTAELLDVGWPAVEAVAAELVAHGRIDGPLAYLTASAALGDQYAVRMRAQLQP